MSIGSAVMAMPPCAAGEAGSAGANAGAGVVEAALPDAHIFIDNSNIFEGARRVAESREPDVPRAAVRLYDRNFFRLVEAGLNPLTRVLAGSGPAGSNSLWTYAAQAGYDTDPLRCVEKGRRQQHW